MQPSHTAHVDAFVHTNKEMEHVQPSRQHHTQNTISFYNTYPGEHCLSETFEHIGVVGAIRALAKTALLEHVNKLCGLVVG